MPHIYYSCKRSHPSLSSFLSAAALYSLLSPVTGLGRGEGGERIQRFHFSVLIMKFIFVLIIKCILCSNNNISVITIKCINISSLCTTLDALHKSKENKQISYMML